MTERARTLRALRGLDTMVRTAVTESRLGYEFSPNSYSFSAMNACIAAERALEDLRAALAAELSTSMDATAVPADDQKRPK